jgi:hypothetical protein
MFQAFIDFVDFETSKEEYSLILIPAIQANQVVEIESYTDYTYN